VHRPLVVLALAVAIVALAVAGTLFAVSERLGDDVVPDPFASLRDGPRRPPPSNTRTQCSGPHRPERSTHDLPREPRRTA
jgi:hypothetical protein